MWSIDIDQLADESRNPWRTVWLCVELIYGSYVTLEACV